jgi:spermidine synthase
MKPRVIIATAQTPDGGEMVLYQHDHDFSITINGNDLMHSRRHESELELSRFGCAHLTDHKSPVVLIGGLGMGYTLRQTLDVLNNNAKIVVGELFDAVVEWNKEFLGKLNDQPLEDERVVLETGDIFELISNSRKKFDTILLDVDNGPNAITSSGNQRLYGYKGVWACRNALREKGCLAIWSAKPSKYFEQLLMDCGFHVTRFRVPAYKGKNPQSHFVWIASENKSKLPPGGGEPKLSFNNKFKGNRKQFPKNPKRTYRR